MKQRKREFSWQCLVTVIVILICSVLFLTGIYHATYVIGRYILYRSSVAPEATTITEPNDLVFELLELNPEIVASYFPDTKTITIDTNSIKHFIVDDVNFCAEQFRRALGIREKPAYLVIDTNAWDVLDHNAADWWIVTPFGHITISLDTEYLTDPFTLTIGEVDRQFTHEDFKIRLGFVDPNIDKGE